MSSSWIPCRPLRVVIESDTTLAERLVPQGTATRLRVRTAIDGPLPPFSTVSYMGEEGGDEVGSDITLVNHGPYKHRSLPPRLGVDGNEGYA
jgi:hypothetical protein